MYSKYLRFFFLIRCFFFDVFFVFLSRRNFRFHAVEKTQARCARSLAGFISEGARRSMKVMLLRFGSEIKSSFGQTDVAHTK